MDQEYEFLLGKLLRLQQQLYVVRALVERNGVPMAKVFARVNGDPVELSLPARYVAQHLVCDQMPVAPSLTP